MSISLKKINIKKDTSDKKESFFDNFSFKDLIHLDKNESKSENPTITIQKEQNNNPTIIVENNILNNNQTKSVDFNLDMSGMEYGATAFSIPETVIQSGIIPDMTPFELICDSDETWIYEQGKIAELWKQNRTSNNSIATYNNRYLVAVNKRFGEVGDNINVKLDDNTIIPCTIMDIKADDDDNSSPYGHYFEYKGTKQESLVEFEVMKNINTDEPSELLPYIQEWHTKNVAEIINLGSNILK